MRYLIGLFALMATPVVAFCPDPLLSGPTYAASGAGLIAPQSWEVTAEGEHQAPCEDWVKRGITSSDPIGFFNIAPTAIFELDGMAPHILMVMADAACPISLAVRSGHGFWEFGDLRDGRLEATFWGVPNGPMQVWVGVQDAGTCPATVTLETFDR